MASTLRLVLSMVVVAARVRVAASTVSFATSYGSHMVLQQAPKRAVLWGYCSDGADCGNSVKLSVTSEDANAVEVIVSAKAGPDNSTWIAKLTAVVGGNTAHTVTASDGTASASISDVLFGDVWVCSGQSNMAFLLENAFNGSALVADADNHPTIRLFTSKKLRSNKPQQEQPTVEESWIVSSRQSVSDDGCPHCNGSTPHTRRGGGGGGGVGGGIGDGVGVGLGDDNWLYMSAVCYIFGKNIQAATGKPVGLVNTNWGGTPLEFWMSDDAEAACPNPTTGTTTAYNAMIAPLLNMTIFGAIWYQGEANSGDKLTALDVQGLPMASYGCRFPAMISDWRKKWNEGTMGETNETFPFGFVQLAPWDNPNNGPAAIRWALTAGYGHVPNAALPNVFDAIAIDLTDHHSPYGSVHIRDKTTVGDRLSAAGLAIAYGNTDVYWQGPIVTSATMITTTNTNTKAGDVVTITFANTGSAGLLVNHTYGWEACMKPVGPSVNNCTMEAPNGTATGQWSTVQVSSSTPTSVSVTVNGFDNDTDATGTLLVRYGWAAVPFEYKLAGVYAKAEQFPAGPFVQKVTAA